MSQTSNWPLPKSSIRFLVPKPIIAELSLNVLTKDLYPLAFGHYIEAAGHKAKRDNHSDHLLILCVGGCGEISFVQEEKGYKQEQKKTLTSGQALLLPKGTAHKYHANKNKPWTIYWVHLDGHLAEQFTLMLHANENAELIFDVPNLPEVLSEFEQLLACRHATYQFNNFVLASNILRKLFSYFIAQNQLPLSNESNQINLQIIDGYLEENINKQISLEQMAEVSGLSKFHFAKKFQKQTGVSPVRYFLESKIKHACELIDRTQLTIKEVSSRLGYDDPYYFSRLFKKIMGLSPKQYRQTNN